MLFLVFALLSGQDATAPVQPSPPAENVRIPVRNAGRCPALLQRIAPSQASAGRYSAMQDERVRLHRLLDLRVNGCSVPVIAVDHVPDADRAVGRNLAGPRLTRR